MKQQTASWGLAAIWLTVNISAAQTLSPTTQPEGISRTPTLAVLAFESNLKQPKDSGRMVADVLSARLGGLGDVTVVERQDIEKILAEQKLALAGMVSVTQATQVGKMLGAQLLVTGRITVVEKHIHMMCKAISAETSQVKGFFLILPQDASFGDMLDKVAATLAESVPTWVNRLVPADRRPPDDIAVLRNVLAKRELPTVAVVISEQHFGRTILDPAVETEFKRLLTEVGIRPKLASPIALKKLLSNLEQPEKLRQLFADTHYLICGEAFSESGGNMHGLAVGLARAEVRIIDLRVGKTLLVDRATARAADLGEQLAAKTALQKAGRRLAVRMLVKFFKQLPSVPKPSGTRTKGG